MICPFCKNDAPWVENKAKYGKNYGRSFMCYYCKPCDAYVGCHNNTKKPLGTMANKELRQWRIKVHNYIDPLWKEGRIKRHTLYRKISQLLGHEYHTGETDIETCKRILRIKFVNNKYAIQNQQ